MPKAKNPSAVDIVRRERVQYEVVISKLAKETKDQRSEIRGIAQRLLGSLDTHQPEIASNYEARDNDTPDVRPSNAATKSEEALTKPSRAGQIFICQPSFSEPLIPKRIRAYTRLATQNTSRT